MKLKNPMLVVKDIDRSVEFYKKVLGLHVIMDFGANKTLTGGLVLQTIESWHEFIGRNDISFGSQDGKSSVKTGDGSGRAVFERDVDSDQGISFVIFHYPRQFLAFDFHF